MRIPLASNLESRDGTVDQDAIVKNCIVEAKGEATKVRKRPALSSVGIVRAGVAQALGYWDDGVVAIIDDYINTGATATWATWNPNDKGGGVTLSAVNLTAAFPSSTSHMVRSTVSKSSGKWYWEVLVSSNKLIAIGVANSTCSLTPTGYFGDTANGLCIIASGNIMKNDAIVGFREAFDVGDRVSVAYDADAGTVGFRVNNGTVTTISGANVPTGALYAAIGGTINAGTQTGTANFGASSLTYTPPSGYNSGLYFSTATFVTATATSLSPTTADLQFSMQESGANSPGGNLLMIKNREQAWAVNNAGTVAAITDVDYPGTYAVTLTGLTRSSTTATATTPTDTNFQIGGAITIAGVNEAGWNGAYTITGVTPSTATVADDIPITITRSGTTATATCTAAPHGFATGATVTIRGANQSEYNGAKSITVTSTTAFTFTVTVTGSSLVTPATGTITIAHVSWGGAAVTYSVSSAVLSVTYSSPHGMITGHVVSVQFYYDGSGGVTVFSGGGLTITRVDDYTLTVPVSGVPDISYMGTFRTVPSVLPTAVAVTSITSDGATATLTTSTAHKLALGSNGVFISGALQDYYGGDKAVTVTGTSTMTYPISLSADVSPITPATGTIVANSGGTVTGASFTFTVDGTETTPATGTITATGGRNTVPGIAYVDGYFNVMDVYGVIYSSKEDAPSTWDALEYTSAQLETGAGVALTRSQNYLVAFKEWSSEFFYNARNAVGSPFSPVDNGFTQTGCASGDSVASVEGAILFMSQARQKGRSVHVMQGITQEKVSTPDVERVLNADDLVTVRAYGMKLDGHSLYILTLGTSNITLVYDLSSGIWSQWSSLTIGSSKSVSSITRSGTTATVTCGVAHTLSDGDPVKISGADQSAYNGIFQASYIDATSFKIEVSTSTAAVTSITRSSNTATVTTTANHGYTNGQKATISGATQTDYNGTYTIAVTGLDTFTYTVSNSPATPATGTILTNDPAETASGTILAYPYTESYFKFTHYTNADGTDLVLHESNGYLYSVSSSVYQDDGVPVNMFIRTQRLDGGDSALKKMARVRLIGEKVSDTAMIRWSDDDSATFSAYRRVTLSDQQPELRRCGAFRRRSMEFRHIGNTAPRADSLEMDMGS